MTTPTLNHSRRCRGGKIEKRPALTRPGWVVFQCECCHAVSMIPDPEPAQLPLDAP